jgi:phosphoesterase RecJ-like protein
MNGAEQTSNGEQQTVSFLNPLATELLAAESVLLATHSAPDGDGIGCQLALLRTLEQLGKSVVVVSAGEIPPRFRFLSGAERMLNWDVLSEADRAVALRNTALVLVVDTHEFHMLGPLGQALQEAGTATLFLDHHPVTGAARPEIFCNPEASSAGEVCWHLIRHLGTAVAPETATCLYTAIAYDTNSFKYLRRRAETHLVAAELVQLGADTDQVYRHVFASNPPGKLVLLGEVLRSFRTEEDGRIAWAAIDLDLVKRTGATPDDLRDLIAPLLGIQGVEIGLTFKERRNGMYKVSLRSKGRFAIDTVAARLGGGGHRYASGAYVEGPLDRARAQVLQLLHDLLHEQDSNSVGSQ